MSFAICMSIAGIGVGIHYFEVEPRGLGYAHECIGLILLALVSI